MQTFYDFSIKRVFIFYNFISNLEFFSLEIYYKNSDPIAISVIY